MSTGTFVRRAGSEVEGLSSRRTLINVPCRFSVESSVRTIVRIVVVRVPSHSCDGKTSGPLRGFGVPLTGRGRCGDYRGRRVRWKDGERLSTKVHGRTGPTHFGGHVWVSVILTGQGRVRSHLVFILGFRGRLTSLGANRYRWGLFGLFGGGPTSVSGAIQWLVESKLDTKLCRKERRKEGSEFCTETRLMSTRRKVEL